MNNIYKKVKPQVSEIINKKKKNRFNILSVLLIILIIILPYVFNQTFTSAYISITLSTIATITLCIIVNKNIPHNNILGILIINIIRVLVGLTIIFYISLIHPIFYATSTPAGSLQSNTTYVAYEKECIYCKKAKINMNRAVLVYNQTHLNKIKLIDLESNKPISKEVKQYIKYNGSIIHVDSHHNVTTSLYTKGDKNGPLVASNTEIYNSLKEISR